MHNENEFFKQVAVRICGSLNIEKALEDSFHYIRDYIPVDSMSLLLYDPVIDLTYNIASVGNLDGKRFGKTLTMPRNGVEFRTARWMSKGPFVITNRLSSNPYLKKVFEILDIDTQVSLLEMKLELEGNRIGALLLILRGVDMYTQKHGDLLWSVYQPFAVAMSNALRYQEVTRLKDMLADDNLYLRRRLREMAGEEIVGADFGLREVMKKVRQVAPIDSSILLYGETGVGKELIANAIHYSSQRGDGPFIKVNCGALPETVIDSELFGHEKGAFTGAVSQKRGRFERADQGTIFLDEIGELPSQIQVKLLHVLQRKEIERVGGTKTIPVDIRVVSATHRNLPEMIKAGQFREDLWYRLNVFPIVIPPLRKRKADIPALVRHFVERKRMELKIRRELKLAPGSLDLLKTYDWPGNVRELQNIVERALIQNKDNLVRFDRMVDPSRNMERGDFGEQKDVLTTLDEANAAHIGKALNICRGKIHGKGGAAELLGVHPNTLRKRMDKLGIPYKRASRSNTG